MAKLDPELTKRLQQWLDTPASQRDLVAGANILLSLNRNRAFYNTVISRPAKYADKLEYEMKKFLRIRLDGMTTAAIVEMEQKLMPSAAQILAEPPVISTDAETPEPKKAKGRRPDHDQLPPQIRMLWEDNFTTYLQIKMLFEELKALNKAMPCDRYDKLQLLAAADRRYRANLQAYDSYVPGTDPAAVMPIVVDTKAVSAARKTISKYRARLRQSNTLSDESRDFAISIIQRCVNVVLSQGLTFNDDTIAELTPYGIKFEV